MRGKDFIFYTFVTLVLAIVFNFSLITGTQANPTQPQHSPKCSCEEHREITYQAPNQTGSDVLELQEALSDLGFYNGKLDGTFGPTTLAALHEFQKTHNLTTENLVNQKTWTEITKNLELKTVTNEKPVAPTGEIAVIIDVTKRTLTVFSDNEMFKQYPCAVGKAETPTPVGNWKVKHKAMNWGTGFGTRWHGLNVSWGIFGVHGTNKPGSIGNYASHGCIRMWNKSVEEIYPWIPKGAPVYIVGNPFGVNKVKNTIVNGSRGSDVMLVQKRLKQWGYLEGSVDGVFGYGTEASLKKFQQDFKLRVDGQVNKEDYDALKLR